MQDLVILGALGMSPQRKEVVRNNCTADKYTRLSKSGFDQGMLQTQTTGQPMAPLGKRLRKLI